MNPAYKKAGASTVGAEIDGTRSGGFTAIASNGDLDRDGEVIRPGCFAPLPATIPVHLDHTMSASSVIARGRPYYRGDLLMIDATFATTPDAQVVREKVQDGTLDSLSIVFMGKQWEDIDGVRTCVKGELLAADIVSVPSNRGARILSMRSVSADPRSAVRETVADALLTLARAEIAECKALGITPVGPNRRRVAAMLRESLDVSSNRPIPTLHTMRSL